MKRDATCPNNYYAHLFFQVFLRLFYDVKRMAADTCIWLFYQLIFGQ